MADISTKLLKSLQTSRVKLYFSGDPMPYFAEMTIPDITHPTETFDNSSMGGIVELADPYRFDSTGDGEITWEGTDQFLFQKIHDASQVYNLNAALAENVFQPQSGYIIPNAVNYKLAVQLYAVQNGTIKAGTKREITSLYKMLSYKIEMNGISVINFDFVGGRFEIVDVDMLSAITEILG